MLLWVRPSLAQENVFSLWWWIMRAETVFKIITFPLIRIISESPHVITSDCVLITNKQVSQLQAPQSWYNQTVKCSQLFHQIQSNRQIPIYIFMLVEVNHKIITLRQRFKVHNEDFKIMEVTFPVGFSIWKCYLDDWSEFLSSLRQTME